MPSSTSVVVNKHSVAQILISTAGVIEKNVWRSNYGYGMFVLNTNRFDLQLKSVGSGEEDS